MIERPVTPWTPEHLQDLARRVLARSSAEASEVVLVGETTYLTRFANSQIHQNVCESDLSVRLRVAFGGRVARGATNDCSEAGLERLVRDTEALARFQPENPEFPGLPLPRPITAVAACVDRTLGFTPGDRAALVAPVCHDARSRGLAAAGSFATGLRQVAVANSNGVWAYHAHTLADFNTVVMSDDSSGWATATDLDAGLLDGQALADEAIDKALRSRAPQPIDPGRYSVVLAPDAVNDLLQYLAFGMGAGEVREGRSFMSDRAGEPVAHPAVQIWDDGHDRAGIPWPFDFEGSPKERVTILADGRVGSPVYDLHSACLAGRASTGHYSGGSAFWGAGPQAWNLFMGAGDQSEAALVAGTERGIYVTRFHYVNRLDPRRTTITGMTRDGTFWIENGRIVKPLQNLRFTHGILEALQDVEGIGRETKLAANWWGGGNRAPALKVRNFRFTGATSF